MAKIKLEGKGLAGRGANTGSWEGRWGRWGCSRCRESHSKRSSKPCISTRCLHSPRDMSPFPSLASKGAHRWVTTEAEWTHRTNWNSTENIELCHPLCPWDTHMCGRLVKSTTLVMGLTGSTKYQGLLTSLGQSRVSRPV